MNHPVRHFVLSITKDNSPDRSLIEGVAAYSDKNPRCRFELIPPEKLEREIRRRPFDGVICRLTDDRIFRLLRRQAIPTVDLLNARHRPGVAVVGSDNRAIGRLAAEHFLERGFRNFAFFGYRHVTYSEERRDGFLACLAQNGQTARCYEASTAAWGKYGHVSLPGYAIRTASDEKTLAKNLQSLSMPLAAFCCHDPRAACLAEACRKSGRLIPKDVAILGVDDDSVYCSFSSPKLSSIDPDARSIGTAAARQLDDLCLTPPGGRSPAPVLVPPRQVTARESSEIYPIKPAWLSDALVFIRRNATAGISAQDVFDSLGLSHTLVQSTFRNVRHSSVQREIIAERMSVARRLLKTAGLSISDVASSAGFASPRYFCQAFARQYGMSPSSWRSSAGSGRQ